jgi:hypothetical protein
MRRERESVRGERERERERKREGGYWFCFSSFGPGFMCLFLPPIELLIGAIEHIEITVVLSEAVDRRRDGRGALRRSWRRLTIKVCELVHVVVAFVVLVAIENAINEVDLILESGVVLRALLKKSKLNEYYGC